uniref:DUF1400 domain-containing protein n=1 Tax=Cyanothece sp. (strain PCC 7425 / ATCC 29141) TaxID=395961 RepID=B8HMD7_CYAP4
MPFNFLRTYQSISLGLVTSAVLTLGHLLAAIPAQAAETINLVIGTNSTSGIPLPVADLRTYAETQTPSSQLASLLSLVTPEQQADLLKGLKTTLPVDPNALQQVLGSAQGQQILTSVAAATLRPDPAGVEAIKTALMTSATSGKGFSFLSFLEAYPAPVISIDLMQMQQVVTLNQTLLAQLSQSVTGSTPTSTTPGSATPVSPPVTDPATTSQPAGTPSAPTTPQ